jgi:D-glycero-alpha-D-manno-heptose 1-phosphate guanylyltransferase
MVDSQRPITAIVLAGGFGTRLRSVVPDVPKPMAPIAGRPFISHLFHYWAEQGVARFIVAVGYMHLKITSYFGSRFEGCDVEYFVESTPLGTGGALNRCIVESGLSDKFLLLNGDTYFEVQLETLISVAENTGADWTLSLFRTTNAARFSPVVLDDKGRVESFGACADTSNWTAAPHFANGGVYWVSPAAVTSLGISSPCSLEHDVLPRAIVERGRVFGLPSAGVFIDIGVPEDYARAQAMTEFSRGVHE